MSSPVVLYGILPSQPYRSVLWVCTIKGLPLQIQTIMPGSTGKKGGRHPDFLKINPNGAVPALDDNGFYLYESPAMLIYLAEKYNWTDLYPTDLKERARVNQYLHWHHRNTREISIKLVAPLIRPDLKLPYGPQQKQDAEVIFQNLENFFLSKTRYVAGDKLTIADYLCFEEVVQCEKEYFEVYDFSNYPNITRWLTEMKSLPKYAEIHVPVQNFCSHFKKTKKVDISKL